MTIVPRIAVGVGLLLSGAIMLLAAIGWNPASAPPPEAPGQVAPYRFPVGKPRTTDAEIALHVKRVREVPSSGHEYGLLAAAYLRQARDTTDPSWYLLADRAAGQSLSLQPDSNRSAALVGASPTSGSYGLQALALLAAGLDRGAPRPCRSGARSSPARPGNQFRLPRGLPGLATAP